MAARADGLFKMGMTPKELNTLLQRHGLFPDKQALALLKEHVDKTAGDPKSEVAGIVLRIKSNLNRECPCSNTETVRVSVPLP